MSTLALDMETALMVSVVMGPAPVVSVGSETPTETAPLSVPWREMGRSAVTVATGKAPATLLWAGCVSAQGTLVSILRVCALCVLTTTMAKIAPLPVLQPTLSATIVASAMMAHRGQASVLARLQATLAIPARISALVELITLAMAMDLALTIAVPATVAAPLGIGQEVNAISAKQGTSPITAPLHARGLSPATWFAMERAFATTVAASNAVFTTTVRSGVVRTATSQVTPVALVVAREGSGAPTAVRIAQAC